MDSTKSKTGLDKEQLISGEFSYLLEKLLKAIKDYKMISSGDKIMVAVSGGKDSLTAMHLLDYIQKKKIIDFKILACNVELGYGCANREHLKEHLDTYQIEHVFVDQNILEGKERSDIDCFWCSWNRRKALFKTAGEFNCNKISLGHHKDDIVHTTLMNLFFYGEISTSPASVELFNKTLTLIRPICYINEEETKKFAKTMNMPIPCCSCPQKPTSKRTLIKEVFSPLFDDIPSPRDNIYQALQDLAKKRRF